MMMIIFFSLSLSFCSKQVEEFVKQFHTNLRSLPTEDPVGGDDIYGLDTSINFEVQGPESFKWCNGIN